MKLRHIASSHATSFAVGASSIAIAALSFVGTPSVEAQSRYRDSVYGDRNRVVRRTVRRRTVRRVYGAPVIVRRTTTTRRVSRAPYTVGNRRYYYRNGRVRYYTIRP
ncbi:MAG TPA: hypothetical protein VM821_06545 [Abditibacteriaceae bacterium]|nr:hypothetical protein [Abditibacteriaceae bacterium]